MTKRPKLVFMGSSEMSCVALTALLGAGFPVIEVIARPDRPRGRELALSPCPAKARALKHGLSVRTPEHVNHEDVVAHVRRLAPDAIIVVAFGQILRRPLLEAAPLGCLNLHASLLPAYRGAGPIQWCIARGERATGMTTMHMSEGMDEGDIILQRECPIGEDETAGELHNRLAEIGAELLIETLHRLAAGAAPRIPQDSSKATYAPKLRKDDGLIDWNLPAEVVRNRIRAFNPWPGCYTHLPGGRRLLVHAARLAEPLAGVEPGAVQLALSGPVAATGDGALLLTSVQLEGGRIVTGAEFARGHSRIDRFVAG